MSSTTFFFLFIPLLSFVLLTVNLVFAPHNPYQEKDSAFECGFSSFLGQNRTQFSISFFIFALLFLLFDLEILLVYPYLVSAYTNGVYGLTVMLVFLLALTLGFAFELGKKALSIDSRQILSSPPKPHAFVSLPVQSSINFRLLHKISLFLVAVFFIFAFRWPIKTILGQSDMLAYYPLANTCISIGLAFFVTAVSLKKLSYYRIGLIIGTGTFLPLLVLFVSNNMDSICICIEGLAYLYTLSTMVFFPIELDSFSLASFAGKNIGSSGGAGVGSSSGAGIGSSTAANVDSSSDSTSIREELDEATRAKKEELEIATRNLANLRHEQNLKLGTARLMETEKRRIEEFCRNNSKSSKFKAEQIKSMEDYYTQQIEIEIEAKKLRQAAGNAPHANLWRDELDAPGNLLKSVQEEGVHNCPELNKAQRKSIYYETRGAIKYEAPPKDMIENPKLKKHLGYTNVLARIQVELAGLDAAKRRNPEGVSEEQINASKASLNLAKLLITNRLAYRTGKYNTQERRTCERNVSYLGDTYYRSQDDSKNNVR